MAPFRLPRTNIRIAAVLGSGLMIAAACSEPAPASPAPASSAQAQIEQTRTRPVPSSGSLDSRYLAEPAVRATMMQLGQTYSRRIEDSGAFRNNARRQNPEPEGQRNGFLVLAAGMTNDRPAWTDAGFRAIEWGLDQAGSDGSFPTDTDPKVHGRAFFIESAARGILLIRETDASSDLQDRASAAMPKLALTARWMAGSQSLANLVARDDANSNQLFVVAAALQEASLVVGDGRLAERARQVAADALRRQQPDGTFPERGGFDASYQSVSLEHLARYADRLPNTAWKTQVRAALRRGTDRLTSVIGQDGRVNTRGSTRTTACGEAAGRRGEARRDTALFPLRFRYLALALDDPALETVAVATGEVGQGFDHVERCDDPA